jgi:DNA-directed RNA polymerase subunit RPC12/RpoP
MRLKKMIDQNRRDFRAIYVCESCGSEEEIKGYDDRFYHDTVTPKMVCKKCGKSRNDLGIVGEHVLTAYPEGYQV